MRQWLGDLLDQYRKQPGPGMLSGMVNDDGPEGPLSQELLINNAMLMLFAGHETTVNLIAHSVMSLLRHPDQLEKLRRRPELIVPGVEELLRFESSVQLWHSRSALADIEIAGTTIPAGATIFLCYGSANRDPQRFENPGKLDLERPNNEHVGYSQGIRYCFGAPLARLEAQFAVGEFFRRVENPRLVEDPPPYRRNAIFRGPLHVPSTSTGSATETAQTVHSHAGNGTNGVRSDRRGASEELAGRAPCRRGQDAEGGDACRRIGWFSGRQSPSSASWRCPSRGPGRS